MNTNDNNGLRPNEEYLEEAKYDDILQRKINYYGETKAAYQCAAEEYGMKALDLLREDWKKLLLEKIATMREFANEAYNEVAFIGADTVFEELKYWLSEPPSTKQEGEEK